MLDRNSSFVRYVVTTMEDSLLQTYDGKLNVEKGENTSDATERKRDNDVISGSSDSTMYENFEVAKTTMTQTTHTNPSTQRNLIECTVNQNKENTLVNETGPSLGVSSRLLNSWLSNQSREHVVKSIQEEFDPCTTFTCPPSMSFTHSLAFSDISIPFPSLAASKSFGPSGIFNSNSDTAPTTQFSCHPNLGQHEYNLSISHLHTPDNLKTMNMQNVPNSLEDSWKNTYGDGTTINDLNIAASALLELTPATTRNDPFYHTQLQINNDHHIKEMIHTRNDPINSRKNLPSIWHNQSFEFHTAHTDENTNPNLNIPTRARIESRAQALLNVAPYTVQACKCKNSKCLKLYCSCFQQGTFCDELVCSCLKCENTAAHSLPRGSRTRAIYDILKRRIDAFQARERKRIGNGCSCKKSKYVNQLQFVQ